MITDQREKEKSKTIGIRGEERLFCGLMWNYTAQLKFIFTALLLLCSGTTLLEFLVSVENSASSTLPPPQLEDVLNNGVVKRSLNPVGKAAYNFILMSAYRGGSNTFVIIGLSAKSLHVFGHPIYTCEYHSSKNDTAIGIVRGKRTLPDWGFGRVYTTVVINCTFPNNTFAVRDPAPGGRLLLNASVNGGFDTEINRTDTILALSEPPHSWNILQFTNSSLKYDYLYCGSPVFGNLSTQRVREWIAYHVGMFGEGSHFVISDAGGIHPAVLEVLKPWMELGYITLQDIRQLERFDSYYHNQFLVINDCLHQYHFNAKWMFFFDVDEFIYLPGNDTSFRSVMDSLMEYSQFSIEQVPMSNKLCPNEDAGNTTRKWGFEKLVYKNVQKVIRKDRKYAIQPTNVFASGVHKSLNFQGRYHTKTSHIMKYFHFRGSIAERHEPCTQFVNGTSVTIDDIPYVQDTYMKSIANLVQHFELHTIGNILEYTKQ